MSDVNSKTARLRFLWKASHLFLTQCPGVSSHCMSQFLSLANDHDLQLHEDIQTRSCAACGTIFVPGINSKVRVVPVQETHAEREKRKRVERKKTKREKKKKQQQEQLTADPISTMEITKTSSTLVKPTVSTAKTQHISHAKKIIRIIPHTEIAQQQQHQQNQIRMNINQGSYNPQKINKNANQILNHVIYSCQRCDRITELPGTKEGFLNTRIKVTKPVSHRRRSKVQNKAQQEEAASIPAPAAISTSTMNSPLLIASKNSNAQNTPININSKRPAYSSSPSTITGQQDSKRAKYSSSLPASPTNGLSRPTSATNSAVTSPASSPRPQGLDDKKTAGTGGGSNKKKKKGGLANLLASQKSKNSDTDASGSGGGGGDSVLANFLLGL
ncbi:hypothetical protein FBU30_003053 [Linnemannia zychae]|nr:hypothetical protein FBU30_003053 [Linnemannia zychae]